MDKIITDKAAEEILKQVAKIKHSLSLIEKHPNDFKYVLMVSKWITEENTSITQFANTMLQWNTEEE